MNRSQVYDLEVTTQGPTYPPSELVDATGNFIVVGRINQTGPDGNVRSTWGRAIVSPTTTVPPLGQQLPYTIVRELGSPLTPQDADLPLYTLPLPLPCNNYPMTFAPDQRPDAHHVARPSYPLHQVPIPDLRESDGPRSRAPITLGQWLRARGQLEVALSRTARTASFQISMIGLIPDSLYTVMSLREHDLDPARMTRPGPLGVPNVFISDDHGNGYYQANLPNPFPGEPGANRIINVVILWMSYQQNYGGAIGHFGLGGDIHAQLKIPTAAFHDLNTQAA